MSGRVLGRGRVLGNPRNAAVQPVTSSISGPSNIPPSSDSSTSLTSSLSGSTAQDATASNSRSTVGTSSQDLASHVSLGVPDNAAAANASSRIICPICSEQMVTLLQLNRHLDDAHQNLEEVQQDEVKNWFQAQVDKAKKLPALAVLEKKFKALDVFESNSSATPPPASSSNTVMRSSANGSAVRNVGSGHSTPEPSAPKPPPEREVTKRHWQRPSYGDMCSDPPCGKRLGGNNGSVNCANCGKLFCEDHTMYQMKLSEDAQHDPVRGIWSRVCETCYKSRDGYNDNKGFERNHTDLFASIRRKNVDKVHLETSRLEKRLTKLTQLLANPPASESEGKGLLWSFSGGAKTQQRNLEQSIIAWEDDATVPNCPFCQQEFSNYTFRRHHCRLCGRVVCGDVQTLCSTLMPLNVAAEKGQIPVGLDVRMCKDCKHTLFSKADFDLEVHNKPPDQRSYENLVQFERGIRLLLPKFQKLLLALQDPEQPPSAIQIADATKVRKRLTDSFIQYETAARRIRDFPTSSPTQARLQKAVYQQASNFLHLNMLPLKALPKILKHASPHGASKARLNNAPGNALASIKYNDRLAAETSSNPSSSSAIESLEAEERELRERLIILEEQKFIVTEMLNDARKKRKFEEMAALSSNVDDLSREIDNLRARVVKVEGDFEGLYTEMNGG
ncbi:hypothetical protein BT63DRAFT_433253 [Microthyrium microscopicum]|uniref:FYVE-type domain-containing protein n=1 Tax=Microthyrium microscopicum TaxID=703497 RepID=A0A6A6U8H7_9PEZI|nr:hypothetical protein BT63DRAFT_433253 [Microthyrium microscopicum]